MFVNFSNHPSEFWDDLQRQAAMRWGNIVDVPFPIVRPEADESEVWSLAADSVDRILEHDPDAVMCQGEFTLCFAVVKLLKKHGVVTVAACTRRTVKETRDSNGVYKKESIFQFERFREYCKENITDLDEEGGTYDEFYVRV